MWLSWGKPTERASVGMPSSFRGWQKGIVQVHAFGPIFGIKANHDLFKKKNKKQCPRTKCSTICKDENCKQEYVHVWGDVTAPHFRIYNPDDVCPHGMSVEHAEAQEVIKYTLNEGKHIIIRVKCKEMCDYGWAHTHTIKLKKGEECRTEVRFKHNNNGHGMRSADVGIVPKGASPGTTPSTIIEVLHSSKTEEFTRPTNCQWFEVFANDVVHAAKNNIDDNADDNADGNADVIDLVCQRKKTQACKKCQTKLHWRNVFKKINDLKCQVFLRVDCFYDCLDYERKQRRQEIEKFYVTNSCVCCDNVPKSNYSLCGRCSYLCRNDGLNKCLQNAERVMYTRWKDAQKKRREQCELRWHLCQQARIEEQEAWAEKQRAREAAEAKAKAKAEEERQAAKAKAEAERQAEKAKAEAEREAAKAKAEARAISLQEAQKVRSSKRAADLKRKAKAKDDLIARKKRKLELAQLRASQVQYDIEHARALREQGVRDSESYTDEEVEHEVRKYWLQLRPIGPCIPPDKHYTRIDLTIKRLQRQEEDGIDPAIYSDED